MPLDDRTVREFEKLGIAPPEVIDHGLTAEEIRSRMVPLVCRNWKLQGNQLSCDTDQGPLVQSIDPAYILRGTDEAGLPILVKVG